MQDKFPVLVGYLGLLLLAGLGPWSYRPRVHGAPVPHGIPSWFEYALAAAGLAWFFEGKAFTWPWIALSLGWWGLCAWALRARGWRTAAVAAAGPALLSASLLWWVIPDMLAWWRVGSALGIAACMVWLTAGESGRAPATTRRWPLPAAAATAAALLLMLAAPLDQTQRLLFSAWHHWGAYVGPVETMQAGLVPFRDIPLQYGAGPTALLRLFAPDSGYHAIRMVVMAATLAGVFLVVDTCVALVEGAGPQRLRLAAGLVALAACMLWVAYPPSVGTPLATPSSFGLRFLPAWLLVWVLVRFPRARLAAALAWAGATLWSVESACYAAAIYWPIVFASEPLSATPWARRLLALGVRAAAATLGLALAWVTVFWLVSDSLPSLRLYVLYALYPPGPLPINASGPVVWLLALLAFGFFTLAVARPTSSAQRGVHIGLLTLLAFSSYYLGRSHDNNVMNLMPAMALLLSALTAAWHGQGSSQRYTALWLVPVVAFIPLFGFHAWKQVGASQALSMTFESAGPDDLSQAVAHARHRSAEGIDVLDDLRRNDNFEFQGPAGAWNALHPLSNFQFLPSADRREFLRRGRERMGRAGWLIVHVSRMDEPLLDDYRAVYRVESQQTFGRYVAIRWVP